jgi:hypothetical protein
MEFLGKAAFSALILFALLATGNAQSTPASTCTLEAPSFASNAPNIFNDRQEQDLGDALAEYFEADMRIAPPATDDQLTRIGERLLATLPSTGIQYRFRIYDSGEINGFSVAGGRIYISRKLITAVDNEDELAGVLAHEIGHLSTHQTAIEITRIFKIRLGITQVTDRADVFAKIHLMMSTPEKPREGDSREGKDELVADHVALYALTRAGYQADTFPEFFDRISMNKGKTGNWLSDVFGMTHENTQRYREALKLIGELPPGCKAKVSSETGAFQAWKKSVVEERVKSTTEALSSDQPLKLESPLRPSLWRVRFSPNGRYVLAQDEGSITVADKDAGKVMFRIDAPDVEAAQFTPDSANLVFHDSKLRVERWDVVTGQRTGVKEMVVYDGCSQSLLAPDGKSLACFNFNIHSDSPRISLRLIDVESGVSFYDKPTFFEMSGFSDYYARWLFAEEGLSGADFVTRTVSPDGRYLLLLVGSKAFAYDLEHRQQVELGGKLKDLKQTRVSFLGPDQLFVVGKSKGNGLNEARILSFPDGKSIKETQIGDQGLEPVTKGQLLIMRPLKEFAAGILEPGEGKILAESRLSAIDVWDHSVALEDAKGGLQFSQLGVPGSSHLGLPLGPLPNLRAGAFSADGKYLVVSLRSRAGIWDLETGKQLLLLRPFRSAWVDKDDRLWVQFTKFMGKDAENASIDLSTMGAKDLAKFDDADWQYRDLQIHLVPMGKDKAIGHHATLEVRKIETQTALWKRDYPHETPAIWSAEDGRFVLAWDLRNEAVKDEIKSHSALQHEVEALKDKTKGLLIETANPTTGEPLQQVVIPEADLTHGWDDVRRAQISGDFVLAHGEHDNTVIYKLGDGSKVGEFFGSPVATDSTTGIIAAVNREDEILVVDERSGKELRRFTLGSPVRAARITTGAKKALLILTADQVVHRLPLPNVPGVPPALPGWQ